MKKLFMMLAVGLFLVSFASAGSSSYDYSHPDEIVLRKTITLHEDRFPTYDYRHGYTYRTTDEYIDSRYERDSRYQSGYHTEYDYVRSRDTGKNYYQDYDSSDDGYSWTYDGATGTHYRFSDYDNRNRGVIKLGSSRNYRYHNYDSRNYRYRDDYDSRDNYRYANKYRSPNGYDNYDGKEIKLEYIPHLRTYKALTCYNHPPKDVLFYRKC